MACTGTTFKMGELTEQYDNTKILLLVHKEHIPIRKLTEIKTLIKFTNICSESQLKPCDQNVEFLNLLKPSGYFTFHQV